MDASERLHFAVKSFNGSVVSHQVVVEHLGRYVVGEPDMGTTVYDTYLGVAQAALDISVQHLRSRRFAHSGASLADVPTLQYIIAKMWTAVEKTRNLVYSAARWGDVCDTRAQVAISACKADSAVTAVWVTDEAMTLCGGTAYRENSHLARLLRDSQASHVMSPTTYLLKQWVGGSLLGLPML